MQSLPFATINSEDQPSDDSRGLFEDAAEGRALSAGVPSVPFYAPRVGHGFVLDAIRRRSAAGDVSALPAAA